MVRHIPASVLYFPHDGKKHLVVICEGLDGKHLDDFYKFLEQYSDDVKRLMPRGNWLAYTTDESLDDILSQYYSLQTWIKTPSDRLDLYIFVESCSWPLCWSLEEEMTFVPDQIIQDRFLEDVIRAAKDLQESGQLTRRDVERLIQAAQKKRTL